MPEVLGKSIPYEVLANAMSTNYESIYDINLWSGAYNIYYASNSFKELNLAHSGPDFFAVLEREVDRIVVPEDRSLVIKMLSKESLSAGVKGEGHYTFIYRIMRGGHVVYHQIKTVYDTTRGAETVLVGVIDIDEVVRQAAKRDKELDSERQRSANYLDAVLATAAAYTDANLTEDLVEVQSGSQLGSRNPWLAGVPSPHEIPTYSGFQKWLCDNLVCENKLEYKTESSRENLLSCFEQGAGRTSVLFSLQGPEGAVPCRGVFYLYRERTTLDVRVLYVIYDLTSQQRKEKELAELKAELDNSRIRNSTSQMKPHFLYNALGSIQEVMLDDPERAARLLEDFTVHLKSCIKTMDGDDVIPFSQELENIQAYVNIESMRLGDRLHVIYEIDESGFHVLPLSIQPLVENSIRHGVHKRGKTGGTVSLRTWREGDSCFVQVRDNGIGFDVAGYEEAIALNETDSTGIRNIRFRLKQILNADLNVDSTPGIGTTVTVRIPKESGENDEGNTGR